MQVRRDALLGAGLSSMMASLLPLTVEDGAAAYGDAVAVYLGFLVQQAGGQGISAPAHGTQVLCQIALRSGRSARVATVRVTFGRQALPMAWDYAEVNFLQ